MGVLCDGSFSSYNGRDGTEKWLAGWMQKNLVLQVIWHPVIVRVHLKTLENGKMQREGLLDLDLEISYLQKLNGLWLKEGAQNTKYFRALLCIQKMTLLSSWLWVEQWWGSDGVAIASSALKFYSNLFLDAEPFFVI